MTNIPDNISIFHFHRRFVILLLMNLPEFIPEEYIWMIELADSYFSYEDFDLANSTCYKYHYKSPYDDICVTLLKPLHIFV